MSITTFITNALIDIAQKYLPKIGKKVAHKFIEFVTGNKLSEIICYTKQNGNINVLLFVHGFSGTSSETFGSTPDMLVNSSSFAGWDIFSIGYSSDIFPSIGKGLWSVNPDITKISSYLCTLLKNQFNNYKRISFVAHSMGGLAVQRAILDMENTVQRKISHVLLFGTPSNGLRKAFWFRFWSTQVQNLSSESDFIKKLRSDWKEKFKENLSFTFKTIAGSKDEFVPIESSLNPFDTKYHGVIEGNHISMIKPKDANDLQHQSFQIILTTLAEQNVEYLQGNTQEINLLLGEYQTIINTYLSQAKEIGLRPLADLVFALECTNRKQEAMKVLQEHPQADTDSDTLGIIGGRHKRNYLLTGLQKDLDKAFEYYKKALSISESNHNHEQVFYHAINLAFLNIIDSNNKAEMKKYAQLALDNCISDPKGMWELATIAEASLYLGDIDNAKNYYQKTAKEAGNDIRSKQSVYSNAYYGYQSLMATKNKNADFLKMLEELFL